MKITSSPVSQQAVDTDEALVSVHAVPSHHTRGALLLSVRAPHRSAKGGILLLRPEALRALPGALATLLNDLESPK